MMLITWLLALLSSAYAHEFDPGSCSTDDLQPCKTCAALSKVVAKAEPDNGEYLHGAQWNGLYTAYVHDCYSVAEGLLKRGANPNWGGSLGSMIISVSDKWPHNNKTVNQKWASLLIKYGASARKPVPGEDKPPQAILQEFHMTPDYADIWARFQH